MKRFWFTFKAMQELRASFGPSYLHRKLRFFMAHMMTCNQTWKFWHLGRMVMELFSSHKPLSCSQRKLCIHVKYVYMIECNYTCMTRSYSRKKLMQVVFGIISVYSLLVLIFKLPMSFKVE